MGNSPKGREEEDESPVFANDVITPQPATHAPEHGKGEGMSFKSTVSNQADRIFVMQGG